MAQRYFLAFLLFSLAPAATAFIELPKIRLFYSFTPARYAQLLPWVIRVDEDFIAEQYEPVVYRSHQGALHFFGFTLEMPLQKSTTLTRFKLYKYENVRDFHYKAPAISKACLSDPEKQLLRQAIEQEFLSSKLRLLGKNRE